MSVEVEDEYLDIVADEADAIMGACEHLDECVGQLKEEVRPNDTIRGIVSEIEHSTEQIRKSAETIRTA